MDPRHSQHPFTRPPERPLIHNPNHHSALQAQSPQQYSNYPPPASQPQAPVHVPFADPYTSSRRDPFLPTTSQHSRGGSYGGHPSEGLHAAQGERQAVNSAWGSTAHVQHHGGHHHAPSGPPPPPPSMPTSHNPSAQPPYSYDSGQRRRSLGGASPPRLYGASSHDPPPPPPSFARPHRPPQSSPPPQQHNHGSQAPGPRAPYQSTFGGGRELPGLGPGHRPGSSMSISSLIGGDASASNQQSHSLTSPSSAPTSGPPTNSHAMQPPSPRRGLPPGGRHEFSPFRRNPSPERHSYSNPAARLMEGHGYSAASPPRPYSNQGSPEQGRQGLPQTSQPYKPMVFSGSRMYSSSPSEPLVRDQRQTGNTIPPRPSSQPTGPVPPPESDLKTAYETVGSRRPLYGQSPEERRRTLGESHHARPTAAELLGHTGQVTAERDRPVTVQPVAQSASSPQRDQRSLGGSQQPPRGLWHQSHPEDAPRETSEVRREEPPSLYRPNFGSYPSTSQPHASYGSSNSEETARRRSSDHLTHRLVQQYQAPPTSDPNSNERRRLEQLSQSGAPPYQGRPSPFDQHRRMGEEMQPSKSFLGLGPEANRRTGRASPLPQAVQGAQAQPLSIGKDPNIKSEFGRMFSGLGSGLGIGPPGTTTPSRQSPLPQGSVEPLPPGYDINDLRLQRVNSQNGRKTKRVKDEEGMLDSESADGRGTPQLPGARVPKRSKHNHAAHHHHHHTHAHHHHHHHHKPDDESAGPGPVGRPTSTTPLNPRYGGSVPPNGNTSQPAHHHHHYHAAPHHHHHAARTNQSVPVPSPAIPIKVHEIQSVLVEAAKRPRRHLGSQLYDAIPELPKPNSQLDDQFGYASKPKALPIFESNPVNCTFTVRVPRYYMKPRQRQQIVSQRHLWGARIYRDDSDPIAAAIHSGWIRGEWDETVDIGMLDPRVTAPSEPGDAEDVLNKMPAAPVTPPADMELYITILILPRIEEYYSSCEYGILSRGSKNHDGLSFMVHKIQWVEEGYGSRGQERGAAALKRRLDAGKTLLSLMSGDDTLRKVNVTAKLHA